MTSLSAVGSGLDIPSIVSQLVAADRAPTEKRINTQGTAATAKLSALGTIKGALSNLESSLSALSKAITTPAFKTSVATDAGFTASTSSTAGVGRYDIEVVSLAKTQKLTSSAQAADTLVGEGSLHIAIGDDTLDIAVGADANLASLAREINRVAGGKGVTASVITSDAGQHLVLNATGTGSAGAMTITHSGADSLEAFSYPQTGASAMTETVAASDAQVRIDGQLRTGSTNTFTDLVEGATITLTKETAGSAHSLEIAGDSTTAKTSLQAFVSVYNAAQSALRSSSNYNPETKKASALTGDSMVRGLQSQLRNIMGNNNVSDLKALGVSVGKDGTLSFDAASFEKGIAEQPTLAGRVLGKDGSIASSLETLLKSNLDSGSGVLVQRTNSLNKQISKLEKDLDDLDLRMEKNYERYTKQFTAMDSLVAQMQNTSNYLTSQLANLPSSSKK
jgi:flagellar hook-associated protein 2